MYIYILYIYEYGYMYLVYLFVCMYLSIYVKSCISLYLPRYVLLIFLQVKVSSFDLWTRQSAFIIKLSSLGSTGRDFFRNK